ncbi:cellulase family glycosylhydrolase [Aquimarina sp. ERC-38]|uniref:cellulase family glycosylhydrolase n=1 Tax=Aquimarina sp. ERC-38 TaxID=2949996 RepID=UPI0022480DED|nr:cellulase family glycosylhydrolase [Aquimarina sp. ERC-38]UZO80939.1 cellulase family glycosylhydrolase [Aquimarina sp. ERC-38]
MLKNINYKYVLLLAFLVTGISCSDDFEAPAEEPISTELVIELGTVINDSYIGNGVQWDPYPQAYKFWDLPIQDVDWQKMYDRLDYMKPSFLRVVFGSYDKYAHLGADNYNPIIFLEGMERILQYCQDNNITVMLGDWGYNQMDVNQNRIFENRITNAAKYVKFLVEEKGFTCIKYYTTVNEPNLEGSATEGDYDLWKRTTEAFYRKLDSLGVSSKVKLAGPDIAPFSDNLTNWVTDMTADLGDKVKLYDIHTYPPKEAMYNGVYERTLAAYKNAAPAGTPIVIGEYGFKYETGTSQIDQNLYNANLENINSSANIALDSNTLVDEYFHGVDLIAATMKIVNAGYSGAINWNLDDAMHSGSNSGQDLKVWGFWNILGVEILGNPQKEEVRPHFYSFSLISRYMQNGTKVFKVNIPRLVGVDAIAVENDGKYMIAINNIFSEDYEINVKAIGLSLSGAKKFVYKENDRTVDVNGYPTPEEENLSYDFSAGETLSVPGTTLTVITNFDY